MKTLIFERPTKDVDGLLVELRKIGPVISVASDPRRTYVYLPQDVALNVKPVVRIWEDVPEIRVESMNPAGPDGASVAMADGTDSHSLLVQKTTSQGELIQDDMKIVVSSESAVKITPAKGRLEKGLLSVAVGPSVQAGDVLLEVRDAAGRMKAASVRLRFVVPAETPPPAAPDAVSEGMWQKLKRVLGF